MKAALFAFFERMFYAPSPLHRFVAYLLLPFSALYCLVVYYKYKSAKPKEYGLPIISVGNVTVGGSGKTPLITALAQDREAVAIILRGYGRKSRGLHVVSDGKNVTCSVEISGDEAMIYAQKLPRSIVIVSEDRSIAIDKAKAMGAKMVFLDDAYSKHAIKKLDFVIDVDTHNPFCLPSGPYRERLWHNKRVHILHENRDFTRRTTLIKASEKMLLVTAIARPKRLDSYLPEVIGKKYYEDHHFFTKEELDSLISEYNCTSLLMTYKDYVKVASFNLPITLLDLLVEVNPSVNSAIDSYIEDEYVNKN